MILGFILVLRHVVFTLKFRLIGLVGQRNLLQIAICVPVSLGGLHFNVTVYCVHASSNARTGTGGGNDR